MFYSTVGRFLCTHQRVIKANISLQTTLSVFKLHNRHFSCCDRQDVPQTCDIGYMGDKNQSVCGTKRTIIKDIISKTLSHLYAF